MCGFIVLVLFCRPDITALVEVGVKHQFSYLLCFFDRQVDFDVGNVQRRELVNFYGI